MTFTGERPCQSPQKCGEFRKGIEVVSGGALGLYGLKGVPSNQISWTYLGAAAGPPGRYGAGTGVGNPTAANGNTVIQLADDVSTKGWEIGDWIVVATTSFNPFETEFVQIDSFPGPNMVKLVQPLKYYHFGFGGPAPNACTGGATTPACNYGVDERAEVGLITRSIKLTAAIPEDDVTAGTGAETSCSTTASTKPIRGSRESRSKSSARTSSAAIRFIFTGTARSPMRRAGQRQQHPSQLQQMHGRSFDQQRDIGE